MPLHTPQAGPEQREDTSAYTKGVYVFELRHHVRTKVTFDAYIKGIGIVTITNDTFDGDFKMKRDNSLKLVSDESILFVSEKDFSTFRIPSENAKSRKPESLKPLPAGTSIEEVIDTSHAEVTGVYEKVTRKMIDEAFDEAPDSSQQTG